MAIWDTISLGGPILADTYFGGGYEADYTQPLAGGIVGTQQGFDGDPFNFTYPTDGQYKLGGHLTHIQFYATSYDHPHVSDQRNNEPIYYPHPAPAVPDPLTTLERRDGKLVLKGRPTTAAERNTFARVKGYYVGQNGQAATLAELNSRGIDYSDWDHRGGDFFHHLPADYMGAMVSTYNRRSLSYGRSMARITVPHGFRWNGATTDRRNLEGWFPAFWGLRSVQPRADLNNRQHSLDTYTPGNPGAGGLLEELDMLEAFGDPFIHITSHLYEDGNLRNPEAKTSSTGAAYKTSTAHQYNSSIGNDHPLGRDVFVEIGVDRFPTVYAYHINGVYVHLQPVPQYLGGPKIIYEPVDGVPYLPTLNPDDTVKRLGEQLYASNDQLAHPHYCDIFNIAQLPSFARTFREQDILNGNTTDYRVTDEMQIEWHIMKPLIDDQPDSKPYIDYTAGDDEFSSSGSGPGTGGYTGPASTPDTGTGTGTGTGDSPDFTVGPAAGGPVGTIYRSGGRYYIVKFLRDDGGYIAVPYDG